MTVIDTAVTTGQAARWYNLACRKCGAEFKIRPQDEQHAQALRALPDADDIDWEYSHLMIDCPLCKQSRGGSYPLMRTVPADERAAIHAYELAYIAASSHTEPVVALPVDPGDDATEAAWRAYEATSDAWDAAWQAYDQIDAAERNAAEALKAFGYTVGEIDDIGSRAERRRLVAIPAQETTA